MLGSCFIQNQSFAGKPLKKTSAILVLCGRCIVSSKLFQPYKTELILFQANTVKSISPLVHLLDYFWLFLFHNYPSNQADVLLFFLYTRQQLRLYFSQSIDIDTSSNIQKLKVLLRFILHSWLHIIFLHILESERKQKFYT